MGAPAKPVHVACHMAWAHLDSHTCRKFHQVLTSVRAQHQAHAHQHNAQQRPFSHVCVWQNCPHPVRVCTHLDLAHEDVDVVRPLGVQETRRRRASRRGQSQWGPGVVSLEEAAAQHTCQNSRQ